MGEPNGQKINFFQFGEYGIRCGNGSELVDSRFPADFPLVGSNEKASNEFCNVFSRNFGCLDHLKHEGKTLPEGFGGQLSLDGLIGKGKGVFHISANHCSDPLCPICCYNWAKKTAKRVMNRFDVFDMVYGHLYEKCHVIVSVPECDYGEDIEFLRKQCLAFVEAVGCVGGVGIYHPKRKDVRRKWYFSPHFHFVAYVPRGVVDGGVVKDVFDFNGYVLKNLGKRISVIGTVLYQLSHAGVLGRKKSVNWFGELVFSAAQHADLLDIVKMNELDEKRKAVGKIICPVCGGKMAHVCRVAKSVGFDYEAVEEQFIVDDVSNWVVVPDVGRRRFNNFDVDDVGGGNGG